MWQMDTEQSEALEQVGAERPDVLVVFKYLELKISCYIVAVNSNIKSELDSCSP